LLAQEGAKGRAESRHAANERRHAPSSPLRAWRAHVRAWLWALPRAPSRHTQLRARASPPRRARRSAVIAAARGARMRAHTPCVGLRQTQNAQHACAAAQRGARAHRHAPRSLRHVRGCARWRNRLAREGVAFGGGHASPARPVARGADVGRRRGRSRTFGRSHAALPTQRSLAAHTRHRSTLLQRCVRCGQHARTRTPQAHRNLGRQQSVRVRRSSQRRPPAALARAPAPRSSASRTPCLPQRVSC
jgi:hypothetical protein